ncbi:OmpH family outer membrane protein [Salinispirillum marinum]|uniref:OmpH family outer membrane protein n=2 Tax=Saccharospirillaceae TaxID=255527 RepID=A0ABV8BFP6_9GAMM
MTRMFALLRRTALVFAFLVAPTALAQNSSDATIAVIDQEYVLFQSEAARQITAELRQAYASEDRRVNQLEQEITELRQRLETDGPLLTENEQAALQVQTEARLREREELVRRLQAAQQNRRQEFLRTFEPILTTVLERIIVEQNIVLLLSGDQVVYVRPELDISTLALERFNAAVAEARQSAAPNEEQE